MGACLCDIRGRIKKSDLELLLWLQWQTLSTVHRGQSLPIQAEDTEGRPATRKLLSTFHTLEGTGTIMSRQPAVIYLRGAGPPDIGTLVVHMAPYGGCSHINRENESLSFAEPVSLSPHCTTRLFREPQSYLSRHGCVQTSNVNLVKLSRFQLFSIWVSFLQRLKSQTRADFYSVKQADWMCSLHFFEAIFSMDKQ